MLCAAMQVFQSQTYKHQNLWKAKVGKEPLQIES